MTDESSDNKPRISFTRFPNLSEGIKADIVKILSSKSAYLAFTKAGDASVRIYLRADQIHAYAPVGAEMEVFFNNHVWKVRESYQALQTILSGKWHVIADVLRTEVGEVETAQTCAQIRACVPWMPSLPADMDSWS